MIRESEQLIWPLEEVFNRLSVENLRNDGVNGVIPIEISKDDLILKAESKGYLVQDFDSDRLGLEFGVLFVNSSGRTVGLYTKRDESGQHVYVLDDELETFKELFLEQ